MTTLKIFTMNDWNTQVLSMEKSILVDFQAPWCTPAQLQREALEKFSKEITGISMFQLDVSRFIPVAMACRLVDFPALAIFDKGRLVKSYLGMDRIEKMRHFLTLYFQPNLALNGER